MVKLLTLAGRLTVHVLNLLFEFVRRQPRVAALIGGIALLVILFTSVAYFWLLVLGVLLAGFGLHLRQQGL